MKNPFLNITTGGSLIYDTTYKVQYNYAFWNDKTDMIKASLGKE